MLIFSISHLHDIPCFLCALAAISLCGYGVSLSDFIDVDGLSSDEKAD